MKRSVKHNKGKWDGLDYIEYEDKTLSMEVFDDGSGKLYVGDISFYLEDGTHASRVQELKKFVRVASKALKTLEDIGNPKQYFPAN